MHRALTTDPTAELISVAAQSQAGQHRLACPTCGDVPGNNKEAARLREELQTDWWSTTNQNPTRIVVTQHCGQCQPHTAYAVACLVCGDGPLLTGPLAEAARDTDAQQLPTVVVDQLTSAGWRQGVGQLASGWVCCR